MNKKQIKDSRVRQVSSNCSYIKVSIEKKNMKPKEISNVTYP